MAPGTSSHHNKALLGLNNTNDLLTDSMESDQSLFHTTTNLHHHHHQHHTVHRQSTNYKHHSINKEDSSSDVTTKNDNNLSEYPPYPLTSLPTDSYSNINQNQRDLDKSAGEITQFNDNNDDDGVTDIESLNVNADTDDDDDNDNDAVLHVTQFEDDASQKNGKNASINLVNLFDKNKKSAALANDSIYLANSTLITVDELATLSNNDKSFSPEDLLKKDLRNDVHTKTDEIDECVECVISSVVGDRNLSQKYESYGNGEEMETLIDPELHMERGKTTSNSFTNSREMDGDISSTTTAKATMGETKKDFC